MGAYKQDYIENNLILSDGIYQINTTSKIFYDNVKNWAEYLKSTNLITKIN